MSEPWILWSSELSPFGLKVAACLRAHHIAFRWMPAGASSTEAWRYSLRRERLVRGYDTLTAPVKHDLDEYPQVPFLFGPNSTNLYDSSAIGQWLDDYVCGGDVCDGDDRDEDDRDDHIRDDDRQRLIPARDRALRLAVRLVDEACDEVGLYLVHHGRWVRAAADNNAGLRLAGEMQPLLGPAARALARAFPARQVRRLPYLFSVAADTDQWNDLPKRLRPPTRAGFPPTHELLETATDELLAATETILSRRPNLFGERFTLADASLYGQLDMNRSDPAAWQRIENKAPVTAAWIKGIATTEPVDTQPIEEAQEDEATLDEGIAPLLGWVGRWFLPLMRQNASAWATAHARGESVFNEKAFNQGRALYDGRLGKFPFRSVVKTFQVRVWQELCQEFQALNVADKGRIRRFLPNDHGLDDTLGL
ncbi:MAG: glutathione S-transferase [Hyphomicrobiaceae bacterium]